MSNFTIVGSKYCNNTPYTDFIDYMRYSRCHNCNNNNKQLTILAQRELSFLKSLKEFA